MIRVIVGWLGERVGWHLAFTASRLAAVSFIVRYCPVPLSPFSFCTIQIYGSVDGQPYLGPTPRVREPPTHMLCTGP
jgi:hypothetical protein